MADDAKPVSTPTPPGGIPTTFNLTNAELSQGKTITFDGSPKVWKIMAKKDQQGNLQLHVEGGIMTTVSIAKAELAQGKTVSLDGNPKVGRMVAKQDKEGNLELDLFEQ